MCRSSKMFKSISESQNCMACDQVNRQFGAAYVFHFPGMYSSFETKLLFQHTSILMQEKKLANLFCVSQVVCGNKIHNQLKFSQHNCQCFRILSLHSFAIYIKWKLNCSEFLWIELIRFLIVENFLSFHFSFFFCSLRIRVWLLFVLMWAKM